jgi:DNA mismatch endonuclease (patch repair protein)
MADIVDTASRSRMMSGIRGKDTKPEMLVRQYLHRNGYRFRLHSQDLPGRPDIVLPKFKAVIQVHGCYWHRHKNCRLAYQPKSRREFWLKKFTQNVQRDKVVTNELLSLGWRVMTVWECALRDSELRDSGLEAVTEWIESDWPTAEFPPAGRLAS